MTTLDKIRFSLWLSYLMKLRARDDKKKGVWQPLVHVEELVGAHRQFSPHADPRDALLLKRVRDTERMGTQVAGPVADTTADIAKYRVLSVVVMVLEFVAWNFALKHLSVATEIRSCLSIALVVTLGLGVHYALPHPDSRRAPVSPIMRVLGIIDAVLLALGAMIVRTATTGSEHGAIVRVAMAVLAGLAVLGASTVSLLLWRHATDLQAELHEATAQNQSTRQQISAHQEALDALHQRLAQDDRYRAFAARLIAAYQSVFGPPPPGANVDGSREVQGLTEERR